MSAERGRDLAFLLTAAALILSLTVSANLLYVLGVDYAHPGGNPLTKFHPATWTLVAAVACLCLGQRDPVRALPLMLASSPALAGFLVLMTVTMLFSALSVGISGATVYVESYLSAGLVASALQMIPSPRRRALGWLLLGLLAVDAAIAIGETLSQTHLVPIYLEDRTLVDEAGAFRPSALADHPLTGAMLTMTGLFLALALRPAPAVLASLLALFTVALLAFGGGAALALTTVTCLGAALWAAGRDLVCRRLSLRRASWLVAGAVLLPLAAILLLNATDIGGRVAGKLYLDSSAASRGAEWEVLGLLDTRAWLFGTPIADVPGLIYRVGLDRPLTDIENCWLLALINLGVVGFVPFALAMVCLVVHLWRGACPWGRVAILSLLAATGTSNSLGRKSNVLLVLAAAVETTAAPRAAAAWSGREAFA